METSAGARQAFAQYSMHPSDEHVAAVDDGDIRAVRRAITAGADVNYEDEDGYTPLMNACWNGRLDMVKLLVERGANPNHWAQGDNPLRRAADGGHRDVFNYLLGIVSKETRESADENTLRQGEVRRAREADSHADEFVRITAQGKLEEAKAALAAGANVNAFNSHGCTALHYTAYYGQLPALEFLLTAGANVDIKTEEKGALGASATALQIAASSDYVQDHGAVVRTLIAAGAAVDAQDLKGQTPLMRAVDKGFSGYLGAVAALVEAGANLDIIDSNGRTAEDIAVLRKRNDEMLRMVSRERTRRPTD